MHDVDPAKVLSAMWEDLMSMSIVFYALAAYEAYNFLTVRPSNVSAAPKQPSEQQTAGAVQPDRTDAQALR